MRLLRTIRSSLIHNIDKARKKRDQALRSGGLVLLALPFLYAWLFALILLLLIALLPVVISKNAQERFLHLAEHDESGCFLESYSQHLRWYRATIASITIALVAVSVKAISVIFLALVVVNPQEGFAETPPSCADPDVIMSAPAATVYCNASGTFTMSGSW